MNSKNDKLYIKVSDDKLSAYLCLYENEKVERVTESEIHNLLEEKKIIFGIQNLAIKNVVTNFTIDQFPLLVAEGKAPVQGKDSELQYEFEMTTEVDRSEGWDFREVMRIPTVKAGEKIATVIPATTGSNGMTVYGTEIPAKHGKPLRMRAGQHVVFDEKKQAFYASADGEVSIDRRSINVFTVYQVNESVSLKTGNIDFVGSVIIRGDVPSGFTVKASGDVKIFGLVEAATIISDKSIFISEGISGMQTGLLQAGEDVHIGYSNQAKIIAGNNIHVENSILHSECVAHGNIVCQRGNVIGGKTSAHGKIIVKDVGNKISTATYIQFQLNEHLYEEQMKLEAKKVELIGNIGKINELKTKVTYAVSKNEQMRETLVKVNQSLLQLTEQLDETNLQLEQIEEKIGNHSIQQLNVNGKIYPNVSIGFGRYKRKINTEHQYVTIKLERNEIVITPL